MNEKLIQQIYEKLDNYLPQNWNKVVFRAEYLNDSFGMKYYVCEKEDKYIDCYKLNSRKDLMKCFVELNAIIKPERNQLKAKWSVLVVTFDKKGKFNFKLDYTDISETSVKYLEDWEQDFFKGKLI